jgi:nucleotide-binding universal stress UspA family protein
MKRILVPTDFSPTSERALRFAVDMASKANGTVILYHVFTPAGGTFVGTAETRKQYDTQTKVKLAKQLQRFKKKVVGNNMDVAVSTIVGHSPIIDNILGFSEHNQIDLIVMGTQGSSGLKKVIIGSVAARVIEKSDVPVLLVPEKFEWKEPEQFVFSTNYQKADRKALTLTVGLAKIYNAAMILVNTPLSCKEHLVIET